MKINLVEYRREMDERLPRMLLAIPALMVLLMTISSPGAGGGFGV